MWHATNFLFSLSLKLQISSPSGPIYSSCCSWGQLWTGSQEGDLFWKCTQGSRRCIHLSRSSLGSARGCAPATALLWGLITPGKGPALSPLPLPGLWRLARTRHREKIKRGKGWKSIRKWEAILPTLLTLCPPLLQLSVFTYVGEWSHHISGHF